MHFMQRFQTVRPFAKRERGKFVKNDVKEHWHPECHLNTNICYTVCKYVRILIEFGLKSIQVQKGLNNYSRCVIAVGPTEGQSHCN